MPVIDPVTMQPVMQPEAGYRQIDKIGLATAGTIDPLGVWAEAAWVMPEELELGQGELVLSMNEPYLQAVVGCDYTFNNGVYAEGQYLYYGNGSFITPYHEPGAEDIKAGQYLIGRLSYNFNSDNRLELDTTILDDLKYNRVKNFYTTKKARFLFQIFYQVDRSYLRYLRIVNNKSGRIEQELHRSMKNEELFALLNLEKSLVYFTTSLKSNEAVMKKIFKYKPLDFYEEDEEIIDDAIIENKQVLEMANIYSNILSGMMDAFASVISNNLNIAMKFQ